MNKTWCPTVLFGLSAFTFRRRINDLRERTESQQETRKTYQKIDQNDWNLSQAACATAASRLRLALVTSTPREVTTVFTQ